MTRKDTHTNISHRENSDVEQLFEELLEQNNLKASQWVRQRKREWLMEMGLDSNAAESLISELEEDIKKLEDDIRGKKRELEELKQRKEKIQDLAGKVELTEEDSDGEGNIDQGSQNSRIGVRKSTGGDI